MRNFKCLEAFDALLSYNDLINPTGMKKWLTFVLAFVCVLTMLYAGFSALSNHQERTGLFFTFVGLMTVVGLAIDFINHLKTRRSM